MWQRWQSRSGKATFTWHTPQYFTPVFAATNGGLTLSGVAVFLIAAVSFSVIITWAFKPNAWRIPRDWAEFS